MHVFPTTLTLHNKENREKFLWTKSLIGYLVCVYMCVSVCMCVYVYMYLCVYMCISVCAMNKINIIKSTGKILKASQHCSLPRLTRRALISCFIKNNNKIINFRITE